MNTKKQIVSCYFGTDLLKGEGSYTVPLNYNHNTQIDDFRNKKNILKSTEYYSKDLTSNNFARATHRLEPGKTYTVKIFPVVSTVSVENCLVFLKENNALLVGAHGLTAFQENQPQNFPIDLWVVSYDEKNALGNGNPIKYQLPCFKKSDQGLWVFTVCNFLFPRYPGKVSPREPGDALICFSD